MSDRILMVEDDPAFRRLYGGVLRDAGYTVDEADDRDAARRRFATAPYPVVLLDLMLPPDGDARRGLAQLGEMLAERPGTRVVVASGTGDVRLMVDAVRGGAFDLLTKPVDPDVLLIVVQRAFQRVALEQQIDQLRERLSEATPGDEMVGSHPSFLAAVDLGRRVAASDLPVLVTGESGTGKELMARLVHRHSRRHAEPFVAVNCGALPENLLESTLFGHVRGAFTGAVGDRAGLFAEADGGTLFLDEVGDMPASLQVKLLRVLESGEVRPVGAAQARTVDVRIVSASHVDVRAALREDLYWRVRGAGIHLPPLRERGTDVVLLAEHFLNRARHLSADGRPRRLTDAARAALLRHPWPGNLRELRHEMQRATVMAGDRPALDAADLELRPTEAIPRTLAERVAALEKRLIADALAATGGNRTRTAEQLGLSRQGLLNKMERYGLS